MPQTFLRPTKSNEFNNAIVSEPNNPSNILYGQKRKHPRRPLYSGASQSLTVNGDKNSNQVKNNLEENIKFYYREAIPPDLTANWGICRPGKDITEDTYLTQHQSDDNQGRTDYVSQIGGCNPNETALKE